jgi:hypothetical protein
LILHDLHLDGVDHGCSLSGLAPYIVRTELRLGLVTT